MANTDCLTICPFLVVHASDGESAVVVGVVCLVGFLM